MRSMVEGARRLARLKPPTPSVSPADCHLPASGEETLYPACNIL
jgi:hypothetical protein